MAGAALLLAAHIALHSYSHVQLKNSRVCPWQEGIALGIDSPNGTDSSQGQSTPGVIFGQCLGSEVLLCVTGWMKDGALSWRGAGSVGLCWLRMLWFHVRGVMK